MTSLMVKYNYRWTISSRNWWKLLPCFIVLVIKTGITNCTWLQRCWSISIVEQISSKNWWKLHPCYFWELSTRYPHMWKSHLRILWKLLYKNNSEDGGISQNISIRTWDYSWHKAWVISLLLYCLLTYK